MDELGIIAEDHSDIETLIVLVRRIKATPYKIRRFAAKGSAKLRRKCSRIARQWVETNTTYIIICHDLDCNDPRKYRRLCKQLRERTSFINNCDRLVCIVIPVQELEAWFLADVSCLNKRFPGMNLRPVTSPENITSPKEYIVKRSRIKNCKPRYVNTVHNKELARSLDMYKVRTRCPAFRPFFDFVSSIS